MKHLISNLKTLGMLIGLILIIILVCGLTFKIWRINHPNAPAWGFFLHSK